MKKIIHILLCFMISMSQAREDQEDGAANSRQESRLLRASGGGDVEFVQGKYFQAAELKYPYIEPKCCNFSTTAGCSRLGSDGFKGFCMPRNETCLGRELFGSKYCVISKHQSCKCCVPTDCQRQILNPCTKLNGTCIGLDDQCNGTSVVSDEFCKRDSIKDTCKCCFPLVQPKECPCGQDDDGGCGGLIPVEHEAGGKWTRGRCMETCTRGHTSLEDHTCNKTGGKQCKCCNLNDFCGETCESPNPTACVCTVNGNSCPIGYCAHPNGDLCPVGSCSCCKDKPLECKKTLQCSAPKDYCVDKYKSDCPKGYSKVYDACDDVSKQNPTKATRASAAANAYSCDCCKSLECSSIGDRCTGRGSFCIDYTTNCPIGYAESLDCSKPSIINGTIVMMLRCKCCKPKSAECSNGCFRIGSQCFMNTKEVTSSWTDAANACGKYGQRLAEPQDPQALSQYLTDNYAIANYWIGAHGTDNNNAAWASGGVIGPDAPWFLNSYDFCDDPQYCMYLQANSGCYVSNHCFGCWFCSWSKFRGILCTCDKTIYE